MKSRPTSSARSARNGGARLTIGGACFYAVVQFFVEGVGCEIGWTNDCGESATRESWTSFQSSPLVLSTDGPASQQRLLFPVLWHDLAIGDLQTRTSLT